MRRKPSLADNQRKVNAALEFYGVPVRRPVKPKRERASNGASVSNGALEKDVLASVGQFLATSPRVLFAVRQNSGAAEYENGGGRAVPIWFYRLLRCDREMTITDYWGFTIDGRPFAIECKREAWKRQASDKREAKQEAFIRFIESIGGRGGFVRNVRDAEEIIG